MFYRLLGMAVWKLGSAYIRRNYGRQLRAIVVLIAVVVGVAGYTAAKSRE
jgi:hypothetical protein